MASKSYNIRLDPQVKKEATAIFADMGLGLSDAMNVFLRKSIRARGFPFEMGERVVPARGKTVAERRAALHAFFELAEKHKVFAKGEKFDREALYDRKVFFG
jgi:DNA-damage-inducible protein J